MFQDVLPQDEEEDEDDIEAHEASIQRLKVQHTNICRTLQILTKYLSGSGRRHPANDP